MADDDPKFVPFDLTELMNEGVLYEANRRFFWPLGLALTWSVDPELPVEDRVATGLHVREWEYSDGRVETIEDGSDDGLGDQRMQAFNEWLKRRRDRMPTAERVLSFRNLATSHYVVTEDRSLLP